MGTEINIKGCINITKDLTNHIERLLFAALKNDYGDSKAIAKNILIKLDIMQNLMTKESLPIWISDLSKLCNEFVSVNQDNAKRVLDINKIFHVVVNFDWNNLNENRTLNIDKEFVRYVKEEGLDTALDKLIENIESILSCEGIDLSYNIKQDLLECIENLRTCKNKSEYNMQLWLRYAGRLCLEIVPYARQCKACYEFLEQTQDTFDEVMSKMYLVNQRIYNSLFSRFHHKISDLFINQKEPLLQLLPKNEK